MTARYRFWGDRFLSQGTPCPHRGNLVKVGPYKILAGGTLYLNPLDIAKADLLIPLTSFLPISLGQEVRMIGCPWADFQPPPKGFENFLRSLVIPRLAGEEKILVFCEGGHGRTGTFLASLISILEPEILDPIAEVRQRYCQNAVETLAQAEAIFALRNEEVPKKYSVELFWEPEFLPPYF